MSEQQVFIGTYEGFRDEFEALCDKYGYPFWWFVIGELASNELMTARGEHGEINEGILEYVAEMLEEAQERI